jgi:hypothetical protein
MVLRLTDFRVEDGEPWDAGDYIENGNERAIGIMRTRVARGQWRCHATR